MMGPRKYFVLSFDGGGVRMVLQNQILTRILEAHPNFLEKVNVFAGTSAGSVLATGLATGILPGNTNLISKPLVEKIFKKSLTRPIGIFKNKYDSHGLRENLEDVFGANREFPDDKKLFITSFKACADADQLLNTEPGRPKWLLPRVARWHPIAYHNLDDVHPQSNIVDAMLSSSAAPTYFPIFKGNVDGGIGNTNPTLSVLTKLISKGVDISNIYILSIGSGENSNFLPERYENAEWGVASWAPHILDMLFDASQELTSQQAYEILGDNFWRVQPVLGDTPIALDDVESYDKLIQIGKNFDLKNTLQWIGKILGNVLK